MPYFLSFILVLTVIVFVHEFGHFWVARLNGVKVEIFSIGFGKELFGFNDKHGTRWKICLLPFGGYVKMFGDKGAASDSDDELIKTLSSEERKVAFSCKSLIRKAAIVFAGPAANYLFSIIVFASFFAIYGMSHIIPVVSSILPESPAMAAGIQAGDSIIRVNDTEIENFADMQKIMALNVGEEIKLEIIRHDQAIIKHIVPNVIMQKDILGHEVKSYKLGIIADQVVFEKQNIFNSVRLAIVESYKLSVVTLQAIGQMITGQRSGKEIGGPIKIAQYSAKFAEQGIGSLLWFMALLSLNLGLMNLLPIPALDGGHLLIYAIEAVLGKKIANKIQNYGFQIGLFLLIMLTIFATLNDISSLSFFESKG